MAEDVAMIELLKEYTTQSVKTLLPGPLTEPKADYFHPILILLDPIKYPYLT